MSYKKFSALMLCLLFVITGCTNITDNPPINPTPAPTEYPMIQKEDVDMLAEQWRMIEISFTASNQYKKPFFDVDMEVNFTANDGTVLTMPAFWDGEQTWKVRFAPSKLGIWKYATSCNDQTDSGLHNKTGTIGCNPYKGDLEIYKRGFLKNSENGRYFTYADGTPFFYLGDTHWFMANEKFSTSNVEGIASQFKYSVDLRVSQGYTVYQSEPLFADVKNEEDKYDLTSFSKEDLKGFANLDRKFQYVADKGLVHSNSQLIFAVNPYYQKGSYPEDYFRRLTKYWVARYGAYPVMWTTAQEIDKGFYGKFTADDNPWLAVADELYKRDPYKHPLTAHLEGGGGTLGPASIFNKQQGHSWFALQIYPDYYNDIVKSFWYLNPKKPIICYESGYEGIDKNTDDKYIRNMAYRAFLSGMYGYAYGAHGVWNDAYTEKDCGPLYLDTAGRFISWYEGTKMPGGAQMTHLKTFFTSFDWYNLVPDFNNSIAFVSNATSFAAASDKNNTYVAYLYSDDTKTGTFVGMADQNYTAQWFNPRTGEYINIGQITPTNSKWKIPDRPDQNDWVIKVTKA